MALASSSAPPPNFDVFLSFRGKDTRHNFTSHLLASLLRKGINAFIDEKLRRGNDISALLDRIERSKIAIVVFSPNFANSEWCLQEVVKILECRQSYGQLVVPIFYKVPKSDVENQTGSFGAPFDRPEERFPGMERTVPSWKTALAKLSNIAGHVVTEDSPEADLVEKIAKNTFKMLNYLSPSETEGLIGMESRLDQLEKLLSCNEQNRVRAIGVVGMAGIGKTTIAGCIFRKTLCLFDSCCFLENIREESRRHGLDFLQRKLLSKLLDEENLDIGALDTVNEALKDQLRNKKVLVVLDDVSSERQIRYLFGQHKWYREGSRIIITTQDRKLIENVVDKTFEVPRLNDREALQLFSLNAFPRSFCPPIGFMDLSNMFVDYAKGHPLALKLLGSDLSDREKVYWTNKLERLQSKPDGKIQEVLEISYEELKVEQRNVFLDIACFFRLENAEYVTSLLHSRDIDASAVVRDLTDKCLVTISDNRLEMHDMLHTIGKEIGSQASINEAGNRNRLWNSEDVCHVLKYESGSGEVRGIFLDLSEVEKMDLSSNVFLRMLNLRYLKFYNSHCPRGCEDERILELPEGLNFLSDELSYLHWQGFPSENLPPNFNPKNLVDLQLPHSQIRQLWEDNKSTEKLKWINLSQSRNLRKLSGLTTARNLEKMNLEGCTSLKSLPEGINLKSLKTLILSGCSRLKKFPLISENLECLFLDGTAVKKLSKSIKNLSKLIVLNLKNCRELNHIHDGLCKLKALQELVLSGCSQLENFPEIKEDMECLEILLLEETAIKQMPNIMHLSNLKTFSFCGTKCREAVGLSFPPSIGSSVITDLYIADCNLEELPDDLSCFPMLQCLSLSRNNIESLPPNIRQLLHLKWLDLKHCIKLQSLPLLPSNLQHLDAHGCKSLESVATPLTLLQVSERIHTTFIFTNCFQLNRNAQDNIVTHAQIKSQLMANASLKRYHRGFVLEPLVGICYPGTEIPLWFCHQRMGSSLSTQLPPHWCDSKFVGFALCAVVSFKDYEDHANSFSVKCTCKIKSKDGSSLRFSCTLGGWNEPCVPGNEPRRVDRDHVFLGYNSCFHIKRCHGGNSKLNKCGQTRASFKFSVTDGNEKKLGHCELMKCGMSLMCAPDENDYRFRGIRDTASAPNVSTQKLTFNVEETCGSKRGPLFFRDEEQPNRKRMREELSLLQAVSHSQSN